MKHFNLLLMKITLFVENNETFMEKSEKSKIIITKIKNKNN